MPSKEIVDEIAKREFGVDDNLNEITTADKYQKLQEIIESNFDPRVWFLVDACLATIATLMLEDPVNPVGLNLVDGPSSEKTTILSMFYGLPDYMVYRTDSFTPASFVSQAANKSRKQLDLVDLLPRIRYKCIIVPELAPIFGASKEDLLKNFSILTRVFDGEGLLTDSGTHGQRGYQGDYRFAWLGATTPIPQSVWNIMGQLGSRLLFLTADSRLSQSERMKRAASILTSKEHIKKRVATCREAIIDYSAFLIDHECGGKYYKSIIWDIENEDQEIIHKLACLAELTARGRSKVAYWINEGSMSGREDGYTQPVIEGPERITSILYSLARGHAILSGRRRLAEDDLPLVIAVSLSSMQDDRRQVIDLLTDPDNPDKDTDRGEVTSTEITKILGISKPTAINILHRLHILKIGELSGGDGPQALKLTLNDVYGWLLTDDFANLRRIWEPERFDQGNNGIPF